jgi:hypothetical protein
VGRGGRGGRGRIDPFELAGGGSEGNGVAGVCSNKTGPELLSTGNLAVATGKIGFYAFIARAVCAGKISLEFAHEFPSARPTLGDSSRGNKRKESLYLIIRVRSRTLSLDRFRRGSPSANRRALTSLENAKTNRRRNRRGESYDCVLCRVSVNSAMKFIGSPLQRC